MILIDNEACHILQDARQTKKFSIIERVKRIREIDKALTTLFAERDRLSSDGLTPAQSLKIQSLVEKDGLEHYC